MITVGFITVQTNDPTVAAMVKTRLSAKQLQNRKGQCRIDGILVNWFLNTNKEVKQ